MSPRRLKHERFKTAFDAEKPPGVPQTNEVKGGLDGVYLQAEPKNLTKRLEPSRIDGTSDLLTVEEAAAFLRVSKSYLDKLRSGGGGPAFHRLGARRVVYHRKDLENWVRVRRYDFTGQYPERS